VAAKLIVALQACKHASALLHGHAQRTLYHLQGVGVNVFDNFKH
jgi:hypothetical protein